MDTQSDGSGVHRSKHQRAERAPHFVATGFPLAGDGGTLNRRLAKARVVPQFCGQTIVLRAPLGDVAACSRTPAGTASTVTPGLSRMRAPDRKARNSQSCEDVANVSRAGRHGPTRAASSRVSIQAEANTNTRGW